MARQYLHIGAFRAGKLVDDRWVTDKREVTVGRSAGSRIWLRDSTLPEQQTLFTEGRHPVLHVTTAMKGELALDGKGNQPIEALHPKGQAAKDGTWTLELPDATRGWVSLGDITFFIQVAPKPPNPPRRMLPDGARTGILSGFDRTFTTVFVIALLFEAAALFAVNRRPDLSPEEPLAQGDLDRFAEFIPPEPKKAEKKEDEPAKEEKKEEKKEEPKKELTPEEQVARHNAAVKKAVASSKLLQVLGTVGSDGAIGNVFASNRGFSEEIADALNGAGGVKIAQGDEGPEHKGASGDGSVVGIGDLSSAAGGGPHHLGERSHIVSRISVDETDVEVEGGNVDKDALNKFIRNRIRSIQACYEKELKLSPALKGKITVRFTVTADGRVGECSIENDTMHSDNVVACVLRTIRAWVFPFRPQEDAPVSFPFVFTPGG